MANVTASCTVNGHVLTDLPVINPGAWFGRAWLLEIGGSYVPLYLVVEADCYSDAIDELSDSEWGHQIHVSEPDLADYPEDERRYDGSGRVIDDSDVMAYGGNLASQSFLYRVEGYPFPVSPETYSKHDFDEVIEGRKYGEENVKGPGKFEGEALYVPFLWDHAEPGENDGEHVATLNDEDLVMFPELAGRAEVKMVEREDGFVVEVA